MKHVNIPNHWHVGQALSVVHFLDDIKRAILRQYGPRAIALLETEWEPKLELADDPLDEDNIPF